jgi:ankyrin repeat protein
MHLAVDVPNNDIAVYIIKTLYAEGVPLNQRDARGETALQHATTSSQGSIIQLLARLIA